MVPWGRRGETGNKVSLSLQRLGSVWSSMLPKITEETVAQRHQPQVGEREGRGEKGGGLEIKNNGDKGGRGGKIEREG